MASSSSHDASSSERKDYDVFLSFRGEDTGGRGDGHGYFAGYLKEALKKEKIITFFADESLESGQEISREIHKAIENSKIAVVILSRNFPGSRWCLDELVKILECKKNKRLYVIPIFYHIKPDAVRTLDGHLKQAFEYSESKAVRDGTPEKVEKWREALKEVGKMSGKVWTEREEEKLIQDTVRRISDKLSKTVWCIPSHIVGIDECVRIVEGKLEIGSMGTGIIVGIWGMAGIGKTTLAQVIYEKIRKDFDESSFLADVSKSIERDGGEDLQKEFSKTLGLHIGVFANCNRSKEIRERLKSLNVLVVVDNVDKQEQVTRILKNVKGTESKSRIIVTTTDKHVLKRIGVENIYEVGELDEGKALTVFQNNARRAPEMGEKEYESLCGEVVRHCCGIPLALEVLGSFLDTRSTEEWRSTLHQLKKIPNKKILDRLEISYKGLDEQQQRVFLCVSCIFEGENEERVIFLLDCLGLFPKTNLQVLKERCLVKNLHGRVDMHDILRKMGRHIAQQKSANDWVLLFSATDIENFLKRNSGADAEIMVIKLKREDRCMQQFHLNVLKNFRQLKLLTIIGGEDNFSGKVEHLSDNLRYLRWDACPLQSLPSDFRGPHLRGLALPSSSIQYLRSGGESFAKLEVIQFCECKALTEIPDISNLPDLRTLDLQGCVQLVAVRLSNTRHERLEHINLKGCMKLIHLPERILFPSLRSFTLSGCSKLERLPEIMGRMDQLRELHIDGTAIMELPRSIKFLPRLQTLKANNCRNLSSLPDIKDKLNGLRFVDLLDCPNLKEEEVRSRLVDVEHVRFGENREDPQSQEEIKDGSLVIQADKGVGCCSIM